MEKSDNEIFHAVTWPSISHDAGQAAAQRIHQCQSTVRFHDVGQDKKGGAYAESKNPYSNQERKPTFRVIGEAQSLCFAGLYTGGSDGPRRDQVRAIDFLFYFSAAVTKTGG